MNKEFIPMSGLKLETQMTPEGKEVFCCQVDGETIQAEVTDENYGEGILIEKNPTGDIISRRAIFNALL